MDIIYTLIFLAVCGGGYAGYAYWRQKAKDPETSYAEGKLREARDKFKYFMNKMSSLPDGLSEKRQIHDFQKSADDIESKLKNKKTNTESAISSYNDIIAEITKITNHKRNNQAQT